MIDQQAPKQVMGILGYSVCFSNPEEVPARELAVSAANATVLPPMVRRRTSLATKMAVSALDQACTNANVGRDLPVIFTSAVGEMAVTDRLCNAIANAAFPLSPTLFHNSVHNTSAGYWSISVDSMAPMQSMAGLEDSFAMGLLEASCQLEYTEQRLLLVSYDEAMPSNFLPEYEWPACATAFVLGQINTSQVSLSRPYTLDIASNSPDQFARQNPALQGVSLVQHLEKLKSDKHQVCISNGQFPWYVKLEKKGG